MTGYSIRAEGALWQYDCLHRDAQWHRDMPTGKDARVPSRIATPGSDGPKLVGHFWRANLGNFSRVPKAVRGSGGSLRSHHRI